MFNISDLREIAIQLEINGESTYREAGRRAKDPQVADILNRMAEEEKQHADWFRYMEPNTILPKIDHGQAERMGRSLLREVMAEQTFSLQPDDLSMGGRRDVIVKSIDFEKDTILFYEMLKGFLDDPATIRHLEKIINEERRHVIRLEEML